MEVVKIHPVIKNYAWGGYDFLSSFLGHEKSGKEEAEAWFGTHPLGDSLLPDGRKLSEYVKENPVSRLGKGSVERFGEDLPLLFKVLSIKDPLSIQVHPSREEAIRGYEKEKPLRDRGEKPENLNYKDPNPKAEVFMALTDSTAMVGCLPLEEMKANLRSLVPSYFDKVFGKAEDEKALFRALYTMDQDTLKAVVDELRSSLSSEGLGEGNFLTRRGIVEHGYEVFGYDAGLLCPVLLNIFHLKPGEAVFLAPDIIHAYTLGNGIELMNPSDNVMRAGLTKKKIDVDELLSILQPEKRDVHVASFINRADGRRKVALDTTEFTLNILEKGTYSLSSPNFSIYLSVEGDSRIGDVDLKKGECCFVSATTKEYPVEVSGLLVEATVEA